jgi:transcriptional regulator with XRE-family HTH domain
MKTIWVAWVFDCAAWGEMTKDAVASLGMADLSHMMGVSVGTLNRWARGATDEAARPSMGNFMLMCNLTDRNPADFFTTKD